MGRPAWGEADPHPVTVDTPDGPRAATLHTPDIDHRTSYAALDTTTLLGDADEVAGLVELVGYCVGGSMALRAVGHHPEYVVAAASLHGGNLAVADNPTRDVAAVPRHREAPAALLGEHLAR